MAINPIQPNIDNTKIHRPYREAEGPVNTERDVKPLPAQGHLIHDRLSSMPKFFVKDFIYDLNAVKDGFKGTANDHQSGRTNDVGLKLGGIGIATMLAARTSNPMGRVMEYAGLGAFLASMSLFPKLFIQAPARAHYGFDPGLEYIDDQGRKKSVFQDSNYIPFDMYRGEYKSQDLDAIGDALGVPRGIKNRDDLTREQMRKIATQNNTLWMLTAGFATPVMTALICCGLEKLIAPAMEKARNLNYNSKISHILKTTEEMSNTDAKNNKLGKEVEKLLSSYKDKELPKNEFDNLVRMLTADMDSCAAEGIKADMEAMFMPETNAESNKQAAEDIINSVKNRISNNKNKNSLEKIFVPSKEEMENILNKNDINAIKDDLKKFYDAKIAQEGGNKAFYEMTRNNVIEQISNSLKNKKVRLTDESKIKEAVEFANILGEFKANDKALDKCKVFKVEHTNETVIARSYAKFENTLFNVLGIKYKDLKQMRESSEYTREIVDKKLTELVKDEAKYEKALTKLSKVMSEMEINLNGKAENESNLKNLITAIENNYNNTAKRLDKSGKFKNTIDRLVKQDVKGLSNSVNSREDLYKLLDGTLKPVNTSDKGIEYVIENAKGVGSSKNLTISRIIERYQGANNSFRRVLHLFDFYKDAAAKTGGNEDLIKRGKDALFNATSSQHTMKLNTTNNPALYKDIMNTVWNGRVDKATENALKTSDSMGEGNIFGRYQKYINRFRDIIGGNDIDFTKPEHMTNGNIKREYTKSAQTRMAKFNLVAQTATDTFKNAAARRYGNQKWLRIASGIGAGVLGATLLAQIGFGRIKNPQNVEKQVSDDRH